MYIANASHVFVERVFQEHAYMQSYNCSMGKHVLSILGHPEQYRDQPCHSDAL